MSTMVALCKSLVDVIDFVRASLASQESLLQLIRRMKSSQESDARKLPTSPEYVVENYSEEEEPIEDDLAEDEPIEDDPAEDEPIKDYPVENEPIEDEPIEDEPIEDDLVEDEPIKDEPVGDVVTDTIKKGQNPSKTGQNQAQNEKLGKVNSQQKFKPDKIKGKETKKSKGKKVEGLKLPIYKDV
nr:hypothetical protein [Tanacetum cinerariifolium]